MKTPITKERLQNHLAYSWWKYALVAVLSVMLWSIFFSVTAYRPPEEKKIIVGVFGFGNETVAKAYMNQMQQDHLPDMEQMAIEYITPDEMYGDMVLSTRIAARECDLYILPRTQFQSYASQGAFMPLEEVLPDLVADLESAGVSLSRGWRTDSETGEKHLYGIPCADLPSVSTLVDYDASDMYISIFFQTGNDDNCILFTEEFVRDMLEAPVALNVPADSAQ